MRRLFLAVSLPDELLVRLTEVVRRLRGTLPSVRWVSRERMHLTVRFLGNTTRQQEEGLVEDLDRTCRLCPRHELTVEGLSVFPHVHRPRVVVCGVTGELHLLSRLVERVNEALVPWGFQPEQRELVPHVTLGRIKPGVTPRPDIAPLRKLENDRFGAFQVQQLTLYESQLTSEGPIYTPLRHFLLYRVPS